MVDPNKLNQIMLNAIILLMLINFSYADSVSVSAGVSNMEPNITNISVTPDNDPDSNGTQVILQDSSGGIVVTLTTDVEDGNNYLDILQNKSNCFWYNGETTNLTFSSCSGVHCEVSCYREFSSYDTKGEQNIILIIYDYTIAKTITANFTFITAEPSDGEEIIKIRSFETLSCPENKIIIKIIDSSNRPLDGVPVRLIRMNPWGGIMEQKNTDLNGTLEMQLDRYGEYRLMMGTGEYSQITKDFFSCEVVEELVEDGYEAVLDGQVLEEVEELTDAEKEDIIEVHNRIIDIQNLIDEAREDGKDISEAERMLERAKEAFVEDNYERANELIEQAIEMVAMAPLIESEEELITEIVEEPIKEIIEEEVEEINFLEYMSIAITIVVIITMILLLVPKRRY